MTDADRIRDHFRHQADACDRLGSPFTARLCRLLARDLDDATETGRRVLRWPGNTRDDAVALRLCGAFHALVLSAADEDLVAAYPPNQADDERLAAAVASALKRHDLRLLAGLDSPPQTNEIARAGMLLPGFITIGRETGRPLAIREIGSSAGLNLFFDRFRYDYGDMGWGDEASPVRLAPVVRGQQPPLGGFLDVASRKGCDIAPVDISDPQQRLRLKSYIWPDQPARLERLEAAISIPEEQPFTLERSDAADFVDRELAARERGEVFVLFHSIMWQYMPEATRLRIEDSLDAAGNVEGADPIAWLRMEPIATTDPYATLRLTCWPGGTTRDLALCDYHGRSIEWLAG